MTRGTLIVIAKEPVPGRVKTRLQTEFTAEEAAALARASLGVQIAAALLAIALTWLLAVDNPRWTALWGWSPMVALEAGNAAHVDVLAALLITAAVITTTRRPKLAAVLLGARREREAAAAFLLPAFAKRKPLAAVGTFVATYIPYLVAAGTLVLGFLPGYLTQEGFDDGSSRSAILALLLPPEARQLAAAVLAVALAVLAFHRTKHEPNRRHLLLAVRCCAPRRHPHLPLLPPSPDRARGPRGPARVTRRTAGVVPGLRELRARRPAGPDPPDRGCHRCHRRHTPSSSEPPKPFDASPTACQH